VAEHDYRYSTAPFIECPECKHSFQSEREMSGGSEIDCPRCGAGLCCDEVEVEITWCWSVTRRGLPPAEPASPPGDADG
jgi:uncharacterized paraquat-inducible protein A